MAHTISTGIQTDESLSQTLNKITQLWNPESQVDFGRNAKATLEVNSVSYNKDNLHKIGHFEENLPFLHKCE